MAIQPIVSVCINGAARTSRLAMFGSTFTQYRMPPERMASHWMPTPDGVLPFDAIVKADKHIKAEGGTAKICFEFDVRNYKAVNCRVIVEGSRKDLT